MSGTESRVIDAGCVSANRGRAMAAPGIGAACVVLLVLTVLIAALLLLAGRSAMDAVAARLREDLTARVDDVMSAIEQQQAAALADLDRWVSLSPWTPGEPNSAGAGRTIARAGPFEPARLERFEDLSGTRHVSYRREGERLIAEDIRSASIEASRVGSAEPGEPVRLALLEGRSPVERIAAAGGPRLARYLPTVDRDGRVTGAWRISIALAPYEQRVRDSTDRRRLAEGLRIEVRDAAAGPGRSAQTRDNERSAAAGGIVIVRHHPTWNWLVSAESDPSMAFAPVRRGLLIASSLSAGTVLLIAIGLLGWRRGAAATPRARPRREAPVGEAQEIAREPVILLAPMPRAWIRELQP